MTREMNPRIAVGTTFQRRRDRPVETVKDVLRTYNQAGELVRIRYVASHEFLGKTVTDYDVVEATIARCLTSPGREVNNKEDVR